jgi:O-antigen/teichoic acid export membrane protein
MAVVFTFLINSIFNFALGLLVAAFLGPTEFGKYALASAIAVILNTTFLDWIRHSATRFYSQRTREEDPSVRATLDAIFALSACGVMLVSGLAILAGADFGLSIGLALAAPVIGICNGLYDYHTALARARFENRLFIRVVLAKNVVSAGLMIAGAWLFASAEMVALAFVVSLSAVLLGVRRAFGDPAVRLVRPEWPRARQFLFYGLPLIGATTAYYMIPLWNRWTLAAGPGFAESGQFSLAFDLAIRLVQTIGSALDILLFQIAVRANNEQGFAEARDRLQLNMGIVLAVVAAVGVGYWLILPSFSAVAIPGNFRADFLVVSALLLPGLVCFALLQYAVTPVFQLMERTWPAIAAAAAAVLVNIAMLANMQTVTLARVAEIQSVAYAVAFLFGLIVAQRMLMTLPRLKDAAVVAFAVVVMVAVVWPVRGNLPPGWLALGLSVCLGGAAYAGVILGFDVAGLRSGLVRRFRQRAARPMAEAAPTGPG